MKVQTPACIAKVSTMADRTVQLKVEMPELAPDEMATLFSLYGKQGWLLFADQVLEQVDIPTTKARKLKNGKTQSQLQRDVYYCIWKLKPQGFDEFNAYYEFRMGENIGKIKAELQELAE